MSKDVLWPIIYLLVFITGLNIRFKQKRKFKWLSDPILLLQGFTVLIFMCPVFSSYRIAPMFLSMLLAVLFVLLNKQKNSKDKGLLLLVLIPPFISFLSIMEHWWWSAYTKHTILISLGAFLYLLFKKVKSIQDEIPYLIFLVFDMILNTSIFYYFNYLK